MIAHGANRDEALGRLISALDELTIGGVVTNLPFLRWLVRHPVFRAGEATIAFLEEYPALSPAPAAALSSPWQDGWRLNLPRVRPGPALDLTALAAQGAAQPAGDSTVIAPMPGVVLRVLVAPGEHVDAGQPLVILSAMKMETTLAAPYAATVKSVHVSEEQSVVTGEVLVELSGSGT